jgi:hypothetical protein
MQEQESGAAVRNILRRRCKEELTLKFQKSVTQSYRPSRHAGELSSPGELASKPDRARNESRSDFFVMGMYAPPDVLGKLHHREAVRERTRHLGDAAADMVNHGIRLRDVLRSQIPNFEKLDSSSQYLAAKGLRAGIARRHKGKLRASGP